MDEATKYWKRVEYQGKIDKCNAEIQRLEAAKAEFEALRGQLEGVRGQLSQPISLIQDAKSASLHNYNTSAGMQFAGEFDQPINVIRGCQGIIDGILGKVAQAISKIQEKIQKKESERSGWQSRLNSL